MVHSLIPYKKAKTSNDSLMIKESCNLTGQETQLTTSNQMWQSHILPSFDKYLHAKKLRYHLILSSYIHDQKILRPIVTVSYVVHYWILQLRAQLLTVIGVEAQGPIIQVTNGTGGLGHFYVQDVSLICYLQSLTIFPHGTIPYKYEKLFKIINSENTQTNDICRYNFFFKISAEFPW